MLCCGYKHPNTSILSKAAVSLTTQKNSFYKNMMLWLPRVLMFKIIAVTVKTCSQKWLVTPAMLCIFSVFSVAMLNSSKAGQD